MNFVEYFNKVYQPIWCKCKEKDQIQTIQDHSFGLFIDLVWQWVGIQGSSLTWLPVLLGLLTFCSNTPCYCFFLLRLLLSKNDFGAASRWRQRFVVVAESVWAGFRTEVSVAFCLCVLRTDKYMSRFLAFKIILCLQNQLFLTLRMAHTCFVFLLRTLAYQDYIIQQKM